MSQQYIKNIPKLDTGSNAVVIGNGNVAIDCSRILLSSPERLKQTDITENALNALKKSKIKNVYIIGRRGPKEVFLKLKKFGERGGGIRSLVYLAGRLECKIFFEILILLSRDQDTR